MICPLCDTPDLEIGQATITGKDFTAPAFYAACHALVDDDPNFGGGYYCGFFMVRESERDLLLALCNRPCNNCGAAPIEETTITENDIRICLACGNPR